MRDRKFFKKQAEKNTKLWRDLETAWVGLEKNYEIADRFDTTEKVLRGLRTIGLLSNRRHVLANNANPMSVNYDAKNDRNGEYLEINEKNDELSIVSRSESIRTVEDALKEAKVDTSIWEVESQIIKKWDVGSKWRDQNLTWNNGIMNGHAVRKNEWMIKEFWAVSVKLRRKIPEHRALEDLIVELRNNTPKIEKIKYAPIKKSICKRMLEIDIVDAHLGLQCFKPAADHDYDLDIAERLYRWSIDELLDRAAQYAPFEYILFPIGNDMIHVDNLFHTTTAGTSQPDAIALQHTYKRAAELLIDVVANKLLPIAPVVIKVVPGNHDRFVSYTLGVVLWGKFGDHPQVEVDDSPSPYKFCHYGVNLIALEHGHSIKSNRMGSLMANECADVWGQTKYREWHCGDQHRPGAAKMVAFSEQNVVIEYLTGLTPANEWSKIKSFNWQPRGANVFVWNRETGKEARLFTHIDSYTGEPLK